MLVALNPMYAFGFFAAQPLVAFIGLGAVVLVVTGGEALYADLGHFGKLPIRIAWYGLVMPALVINYFGQGAMLLDDPDAMSNPFYLMAPKWAVLPLVVLATAATVIASQALITAAFSVTKQAVQLGMLPRMRVHHTSVRDTGQIYLPLVNWGLYVFIVLAVVLFRSSSNLASAYGIAVTLDMTITTVMTFFVIRYGWKYPLWLCLAATGIFFVIDIAFFASNMLKLFAGGWFPIVIGIGMFTLMLTWMNGRKLVSDRLQAEAIDLPGFLDAVFVSPPMRVAGTAVFLAAEEGLTPNALMHNLKHNKVLHAVQPVRHRQAPRGAVGRLRQARADDAAGPRLLAGDAALRLQERPRRARGAEAARRPRRAAGRDGDQLLPVARQRHPHAGRRHGAVAREALRRHAPQCGRGGRLPEPAGQPHRRAGFESRDLMRGLWRDLSLSAVIAGFVAVLVGFTSSVAIVFAAAQALGATPAQTTSWMWALGLGMGLTSIGLSLWTRQPVLTAWSTPGAALLAGSSGIAMGEAIGAFVACGVLIMLAGLTRAFERVMDRIPQAIAAALLAGVLARFGLDAVGAVKTAPLLVCVMAVVFLLGRRFWPRYAVPGVLLAGIGGRRRAAAAGPVGGGLGHGAAGVDHAAVQHRRADRRGAAAVRGDDGLAEPARRGRAARRGL